MKNQIWSLLNYVVGSENCLAFTNSSAVNIFIISSKLISSRSSSFITRNIHDIPFFKTKHAFFKNFVFSSTIIEWNILDHRSNSFKIFRKSIVRFIRISANSLFNCHNPQKIKCITRLRLGLSHLGEDKFKHSFQDSLNPFCSCV